MRRLLGLISLASVSFLGCGKVASTAAQRQSLDATPVFYELYQPGDPTTDQATSSTSHSSLVGTFDAENSDVADTDFAANVAAPALKAGASLFLSLGQCYSGGFIDDLAALGGSQSVITSARHTETASYGYEAPEGVDIDFTDAFISGLADGNVPAETVAALTASVDPFGPNPDTARVSEPLGSEHTQFFATGDGAALKTAAHAATGLAVLWAGAPAERDGTQMKLMIDRLVAMGYARDRIWLMYGGGEADVSHPIVQDHIANQAEPIHLVSATRDHLVDLFKATFGPAKKKAAPDFVFLYVGDHGGLDEAKVAKLNFGRPDALVTPALELKPGVRLYGDGDAVIR